VHELVIKFKYNNMRGERIKIHFIVDCDCKNGKHCFFSMLKLVTQTRHTMSVLFFVVSCSLVEPDRTAGK